MNEKIQKSLGQKRKKLQSLSFDSAINKVKNTAEISQIKKEIARLLTTINQKKHG